MSSTSLFLLFLLFTFLSSLLPRCRSQIDVQNYRTSWNSSQLKYPNIKKDLRVYVAELSAQLRASTARWKVVFGHHPIYTQGRGHNAEAVTLKEEYRFEDVLVEGGADVYLAGHEVYLSNIIIFNLVLT